MGEPSTCGIWVQFPSQELGRRYIYGWDDIGSLYVLGIMDVDGVLHLDCVELGARALVW